jgi:hypothetical protein
MPENLSLPSVRQNPSNILYTLPMCVLIGELPRDFNQDNLDKYLANLNQQCRQSAKKPRVTLTDTVDLCKFIIDTNKLTQVASIIAAKIVGGSDEIIAVIDVEACEKNDAYIFDPLNGTVRTKEELEIVDLDTSIQFNLAVQNLQYFPYIFGRLQSLVSDGSVFLTLEGGEITINLQTQNNVRSENLKNNPFIDEIILQWVRENFSESLVKEFIRDIGLIQNRESILASIISTLCNRLIQVSTINRLEEDDPRIQQTLNS